MTSGRAGGLKNREPLKAEINSCHLKLGSLRCPARGQGDYARATIQASLLQENRPRRLCPLPFFVKKDEGGLCLSIPIETRYHSLYRNSNHGQI